MPWSLYGFQKLHVTANLCAHYTVNTHIFWENSLQTVLPVQVPWQTSCSERKGSPFTVSDHGVPILSAWREWEGGESSSVDNIVLHRLQWLLLLASAQASVIYKHLSAPMCRHCSLRCHPPFLPGSIKAVCRAEDSLLLTFLDLGKLVTTLWFMPDTAKRLCLWQSQQGPKVSRKSFWSSLREFPYAWRMLLEFPR